MIVNLIKKQQMFSSKLPTKVNGQYWIRDIDEMGRKKNLIEIEAQGGAWVLKSNKQIAIIGESNERLESVILRENVFLNLQIADDMKALSIYLEKEILERIEEGKFDYREEAPYFLIVAADKRLAERSEIVQKLIAYNGDGGYSVLMLYEEIRNLPKETSAVIEVNETEGKLYDKDDITDKVQRFLPETQFEEEFARIMEQMADIELELPERNYVLPDSITFLEMFHVGKI